MIVELDGFISDTTPEYVVVFEELVTLEDWADANVAPTSTLSASASEKVEISLLIVIEVLLAGPNGVSCDVTTRVAACKTYGHRGMFIGDAAWVARHRGSSEALKR